MKTVTFDPEKWQLVPKEPTEEMVHATRFYKEGTHTLATAYRAMLQAAPQPEQDEVRIVSYCPNMTSCTLNYEGKEYHYNLEPVDVEPAAFRKLSDVQWMNIVNHNGVFCGLDKEEAVHLAVKMTENKLAEINAYIDHDPEVAKLRDKLAVAREALEKITTDETSDDWQLSSIAEEALAQLGEK